MTPLVHILATCTNPDLIRGTLLVFNTLRVGFPTAPVKVWGNHLSNAHQALVQSACKRVGATYEKNLNPPRVHGRWLAQCLQKSDPAQPLVFLDTDVVFWAPVEGWEFKTGLAGRYIRRFRCPFTRCVTEPRLHSSLLFVNPIRLGQELAAHGQSFHESRFNPLAELWPAVTMPERTRAGVVNHFYDTGCLAYQAAGGTAFTPEQLDAYDHLHAGTWIDELAPAMTDCRLLEMHTAVHANPAALRGAWRGQNDWYHRHAC